MYYEIRVARHGKLFFSTSERSCQTEDHAIEVFGEICASFPESLGYKVDVVKWENVGHPVRYGAVSDSFIPA